MSRWQIPQQPNVGSARARVRLQFPILYGMDGFAKNQPRNSLRKASTWGSVMGTMGTAGFSCKYVCVSSELGMERNSPGPLRTSNNECRSICPVRAANPQRANMQKIREGPVRSDRAAPWVVVKLAKQTAQFSDKGAAAVRDLLCDKVG